MIESKTFEDLLYLSYKNSVNLKLLWCTVYAMCRCLPDTRASPMRLLAQRTSHQI